jgi:GDP-L-fucose synthase
MKKILITGGDGFLARSFAKSLVLANYELVICNRAALDLTDAMLVRSFIDKNQFDVVIHTATYDSAPKDSPKDPAKVLETNLRMFFNLAQCRHAFGKMLYFGSGAEFGRQNWRLDMDESCFNQAVPDDQYGYSKYLMNLYAQQTDNIFNLRLFGVFGELDNWRYRIISNLCAQAVLGLPITVHQNSRMDLLYIQDLIQIVRWFIEASPHYQDYNVCSGIGFEFARIAREIQLVTKDASELVVNHSDIHKEYGGNNQRLLAEMKELELTPVEQSLANMFNFYQNNKHELSVEQLHFR